MMEKLTYHCLGLGFIALSLKTNQKKKDDNKLIIILDFEKIVSEIDRLKELKENGLFTDVDNAALEAYEKVLKMYDESEN